jgi:DNA-binding NarL/FixJ family response regulator
VARILISEPDPETRILLELHVLRLGHQLLGGGPAADEQPAAVLVEPASTAGLHTARALRSRYPELPIICISIHPPSPETAALEPSAYLLKPVRRSDLERALRDALRPRTVCSQTPSVVSADR